MNTEESTRDHLDDIEFTKIEKGRKCCKASAC